MKKNKITTSSYFIKRLRDCGYVTDKLFSDYGNHDARSWTVVIDPKNTSVFVTCFNNHNFFDEEYFVLYDGGQYIPENFKLKTSSIEVLVEYLNKFNIYNKYSYTNVTEKKKIIDK
jgi:hypothetical protein